MIIKNVIEIDGQEVDFEDMSPELRDEIANDLNEIALRCVNYIRDKNV